MAQESMKINYDIVSDLMVQQLLEFKRFLDKLVRVDNEVGEILERGEEPTRKKTNELGRLMEEYREFAEYFIANDVNLWGSETRTPATIAAMLAEEKLGRPILLEEYGGIA